MAKKKMVSSFTDGLKREWIVTFDGNTMRDVDRELGINLCDAVPDLEGFMASINAVKAMAIVWIACRDDAEKIDVDAESFNAGLFGEALEACQTAFFVALVNFSQPAKVRDKMLAAWDRLKEKLQERAKATEMSDEEVDLMVERELDAIVDKVFKKKEELSSVSSTNSPASLESTPAVSVTKK